MQSCYGWRRQKRHVEDSHLKINGPMKGVLEDNEESNMEMSTRMQNNDLTIITSSGLPNMDVEDNINEGPINESIHDEYMESDGDHGHAEEQINIEPTSSEVLNSINMNNNEKPNDSDIPYMVRVPLYADAQCSIL